MTDPGPESRIRNPINIPKSGLMNNLKIVGPALPDMPWEERPAGSNEVLWRYSANPIIGRHAL